MSLKKPKTVTVYRDLWQRGQAEGSLLDPDGMCCLGFAAIAAGLTHDDVLRYADPADLLDNHEDYNVMPGFAMAGFTKRGRRQYVNAKWIVPVIKINDDADIHDAERETTLREMFREAEIHLRFVDKAPLGYRKKYLDALARDGAECHLIF